MARSAPKRSTYTTSPLAHALARMAYPPSAAVVGWGLALLVVIVFATGLGYPLVFGDYAVLSSAKLAGYGRSLPSPVTTWLADASFGWSSLIFGVDWSWHRALNIALHASTVVMAYAVGRRLLSAAAPGDLHPDWVALLAAGFLALHPVSVYATAYLAVRSSLLAGLCCLVVLWSLVRATESTSPRAGWLIPVGCLVAVLSAPIAVALPLALLVVMRNTRATSQQGHPRMAVAAATALVAGWILWSLVAGGGIAAGDYLQVAGENAVRWLRGIGFAFVPVTAWMAIDMPESSPAGGGWLGALAGVAVIGMLGVGLAGVGHARSRVPSMLIGCIGAFGVAAMAYPRAWSEFAAWHVYPALFFACALVAWGLAQIGVRALAVAGVAAFGLLAVLGIATLQTFSSHMAVWDDAVRAAERSGPRAEFARVYVNRATLHRASGHAIAAIQDYTQALTLAPDLPRALRGRAQAYVDDKRYAEALKDLQRLLEIEPKQAITHADIGLVLMQTGKFGEALKSFNAAVQQGVREPRLFLNRGLALYRMGGLGAAPRALDDIERALSIDAGYALAHFNRALIFEQAARAGVRLRDAASPEIMRLVAAQNIAQACRLGHRPACDVERARAEEKARSQSATGGATVLTPEMLREQGLTGPGR